MKGEEAATTRLTRCRRDQVFIPQPVVAEVACGLARMPESKRKRNLVQRLQWILKNIQRIAWTDEVSEHFVRAKSQFLARDTTLEDFDLAVAAHGHILVSENERHMSRIPNLRLESWSEPNSGNFPGSCLS